MTLRYRFIDLTSITDVSQLLQAAKLQSASMLQAPNKPSIPLHSVFECLKKVGAQTLLVQESVRDPDFTAEHQAFYSKQHRPVERTCWRLHGFSVPMPKLSDATGTAARDVLDFLDGVSEQNYLGFVTIRPLRHAPVGASILVPPQNGVVTCHEQFPVHIAGKSFQVCGTPFLQQDNAVGACAQASIWIALRTQMKRVGNIAYTPAELTLAATRYLAFDRVFPGRQGLVIEQMLEAIRSSGHDPLTLTCGSGTAVEPHTVIEAALPYVESGLPVIATLVHQNGGHAVVCIGRSFKLGEVNPTPQRLRTYEYNIASDWVESLVVHNDNTGPYLPLASGNAKSDEYCLEHARNLIIPLPETVHMTAKEAEQSALGAVAFASVFLTQFKSNAPKLAPDIAIVLRTYLVRRHTFRRWALEDPDIDPALRDRYRTMELPKLVWFVELHETSLFNPKNPDSKSRVGEVVIDASADSLHGDAALAVHVMQHMYPKHAGDEVPLALAAFVGDYANLLRLDSNQRGCSMPNPWQ